MTPSLAQMRFTNGSDRVLFVARPEGSTSGLLVAPAPGGQGVLVSGPRSVRSFTLRADDLVVGFADAEDLYLTGLDGTGSPQRVNEFDAVVDDAFRLGSERVFYLAAPHAALARKELYSRRYATFP